MPTGLADLEEDRIDAGVFRRPCNVWTVGPLAVEACYELEPPTVTVIVTLFGVDIGRAVLDPQHAMATIAGSIYRFKVRVTATMDFDTRSLTLDAELCAPVLGCKDYQTIIQFSTVAEPAAVG